MLVLERKIGEALVIDGRTTVRVKRIKGKYVYLEIEAPEDVRVLREESVR